VHPQLRIQDAFNTLDRGLDLIASGGVTTSLVLPGSGTLMGGEGFLIKMLNTQTHLSEDMSFHAGMKTPLQDETQRQNVGNGTADEYEDDGMVWRYMKMACGENPRNIGRWRNKMPFSRSGSGWLFREYLDKARTVMQKQVHSYPFSCFTKTKKRNFTSQRL
jgi:hypothetical protein